MGLLLAIVFLSNIILAVDGQICFCGNCQPGFLNIGGICYQFVTTPKPWSDASKHCHSMGANLVSIDNTFDSFNLFEAVSLLKDATNCKKQRNNIEFWSAGFITKIDGPINPKAFSWKVSGAFSVYDKVKSTIQHFDPSSSCLCDGLTYITYPILDVSIEWFTGFPVNTATNTALVLSAMNRTMKILNDNPTTPFCYICEKNVVPR
ncbi:hypothetical protein HELRODRAFT_169063 [Helobdella robusta]|uniref:C-type lectin domain-containing protein n=1 Tax=Helobdella robusta TaxID=6412 RepID=T1F1C7_HELRO|nr:hypothetical protein HELRODRAFT_169063 [Helobdella robusta]ESO09122.1 hypothetical protein HELRODRAFT_169063 [Helobdella robusta]